MNIEGTLRVPRYDVLTAWQKLRLGELEAFFVDPISSDAAVVHDGAGNQSQGIPGELFIVDGPFEEYVESVNPENLTSMIDWQNKIELVDHLKYQSDNLFVNADIDWVCDGEWQIWVGIEKRETGEIKWFQHETYDNRKHAEDVVRNTTNPTRIERLDQ